MSLRSIDPSTGETLREYAEMSATEIDDVLRRAAEAQRVWTRAGLRERAGRLKAAANALRLNGAGYAHLMAREMGKPLRQGRDEIEKCAWVCDYYAENGARFLEDRAVETDARESYVAFRPLGTVLAVMPWNFPFWQVFRCAAPNLMAGNAVVLKHASNVPGCALAIEELMRRAGFADGLFTTLLVGSSAVADVVARDEIAAVTLTGSSEAGRAVAAAAGAALKKSVLELGGSDPYVVLEDADLPAAVEACVTSRLVNSGQSCIAAKRFVVVRSRVDEFAERMVASMRRRSMGNPLAQEDVDLGPLARRDLRDTLHFQVEASVEAGAELLLGGEVPGGPGAFYPPTVLGGVGRGMPAYATETFGPVAAIIPVDDEEEAVAVANDTSFGLGAAVFTADRERGERLARERLDAGCCFVNDFVRSDPRLPFGGVRGSGYGRELGAAGIREFVNVKTVWIGGEEGA